MVSKTPLKTINASGICVAAAKLMAPINAECAFAKKKQRKPLLRVLSSFCMFDRRKEKIIDIYQPFKISWQFNKSGKAIFSCGFEKFSNAVITPSLGWT